MMDHLGGTKSNDKCPQKRDGTGRRQRHRGGHVKMEAKIAMMQPQAKEHLGPPGAGRGRKNSLLEPLEKSVTWLTH